MLGSAEMQKAAELDKLNDRFAYAVAGHDADETLGDNKEDLCGQCYEIHFTPNSQRPPLIVQNFNSQAGGPKNFDIYMAGGGWGNYNACFFTKGSSRSAQPDKANGSFMYTKYPSLEYPVHASDLMCGTDLQSMQMSNNGGTRGGRAAHSPDGDVCNFSSSGGPYLRDRDACKGLFQSTGADFTNTAQSSCQFAYDNNYHFNGQVEKVRRVLCPTNLTNVTGLHKHDTSLPVAGDIHDQSGWVHKQHTTTTMEDCCKPTCSFKSQVNQKNISDANYGYMYSCDANGQVLREMS